MVSFVVLSIILLFSIPIYIRIYRNWISYLRSRNISNDRMTSTRIYYLNRYLGFRMVWIMAWLFVKIVYLPGIIIIIYISNNIYNINTSPLSSIVYIVEVVDIPMYSFRVVQMPLIWSTGAVVAIPI
jgi:hypothetical protein